MAVKAVGYCRVSTQSQVQDGESLSTQRAQIEHFALNKGWQLVDVYEDRGISGAKTENRPAFMTMIDDAKAKKFDIICFSRLSRFARNAGDFIKHQEMLDKYNVQLVSIKEGIDPSTHTGRMLLGLVALIAAWEKENIREQMSENKIIRWRENRAFIGRPPYGYVWNNQTKMLEINEAEAAIYRRIVDMYLKKSMSYRDIALTLRSEGIGSKDAFFSTTMIGKLLKREAYYGNLVMNQWTYVDGVKGAGKHQSNKMKPASEHIRFECPPLITKQTWDDIQAKLSGNKIRTKRTTGKNGPYWLRNTLVCGLCGATVKPHHGRTNVDGTFQRYYTCHWRSKGKKAYQLANKSACSLPFIKADELEDAVWWRLMYYLAPSHEKVVDQLFTQESFDEKVSEINQSIARHKDDIKRKELARKRLFDLLHDDRFDPDELHTRLNDNFSAIRLAEMYISQAQNNLNEIDKKRADIADWKKLIGGRRDILEKLRIDLNVLDLDDRRKLIERLLTTPIPVHIDYEDLESKWTLGSFNFSFNSSVIQELIDDGKLPSLSKHDKQHGHWNRCQACGS
ncbi:MAG: recombinase family protein [Pseudomonadota bacterium]